MKKVNWKKLIKRRVLGIGIMVLGVIVVFAPIFFGEWIIGRAKKSWGDFAQKVSSNNFAYCLLGEIISV